MLATAKSSRQAACWYEANFMTTVSVYQTGQVSRAEREYRGREAAYQSDVKGAYYLVNLLH